MALDLSVIILTHNEEKHLARCIKSVEGIATSVIVVDSFSSDRTLDIAREHGARVFQNPWTNNATQFNWVLDHVPLHTGWVLRLDADEIVTVELEQTVARVLDTVPKEVSGLTVNRRIHFLGRWIRHGAMYPIRMLRIFRVGAGRCEQRWMDEHIVVSGNIAHLHGDIIDINLNGITWWINKHNHYASREAIDLIQAANHNRAATTAISSGQARYKRWIKENIYARLPLGVRPALYFSYRYFFRLGFLDGWPGLAFHVLQGFWYRFLVDVKVTELRTMMATDGLTLAQVIKREYGYDL